MIDTDTLTVAAVVWAAGVPGYLAVHGWRDGDLPRERVVPDIDNSEWDCGAFLALAWPIAIIIEAWAWTASNRHALRFLARPHRALVRAAYLAGRRLRRGPVL
ncbi:MAG: hypothetical protein AB7P02_12715 [Alphaproteobacteria bacterium]